MYRLHPDDDITESESESDPLEKGKGKAGGKGNGGEGQARAGTAGDVLGKAEEVLGKILVAKRHLEQEWARHPGNKEQKANHLCKIAVAMDALECSSEDRPTASASVRATGTVLL